VKELPQRFDIASPDRLKDLCPRVRRIEAHEVCGVHTKAFCQRKECGHRRETTASLDLTEVCLAQFAVPRNPLLGEFALQAQRPNARAKATGETSGARVERHALTLGRNGVVLVQLE
jgi:hypothetical protein